MSFSQLVKKELAGHYGMDRHCDIAEIAGIINYCGMIIHTGGVYMIRIQTENAVAAKKYFTLIKRTFGINCEVSIKNSRQFKKNRLYILFIGNQQISKKLLLVTGLLMDKDGENRVIKRVDPLVVRLPCCKRAYVRGAFLAGGSLSDPEKAYHLEFVNSDFELSEGTMNLLNTLKLNAKMIRRKSCYVVYLKEGENIVDLLNIMEAHVSLMNLENVRILKDMRNKVNREVNCETANLNKTVNAALEQIEDIKLILGSKAELDLSQQLLDVADMRLKYPDASLKEIGAMLTPRVSKSGVNHRLRKISEIADSIREGKK